MWKSLKRGERRLPDMTQYKHQLKKIKVNVRKLWEDSIVAKPVNNTDQISC